MTSKVASNMARIHVGIRGRIDRKNIIGASVTNAEKIIINRSRIGD